MNPDSNSARDVFGAKLEELKRIEDQLAEAQLACGGRPFPLWRQRDRICSDLIDQVLPFGMSMAIRCANNRSVPEDCMDDLRQTLAVVTLTHLREYDSSQSNPPTFFAPYFREAITDYFRSSTHRMNRYDAKNAGLVASASHDLEADSLPVTPERLAAKTNLTEGVVMEVQSQILSAATSNLDEEEEPRDPAPTPELLALDREHHCTLRHILNQNLSDQEFRVLTEMLSIDPTLQKDIREASAHLNLSADELRRIYSECMARLYGSQNLDVLCRQADASDYCL